MNIKEIRQLIKLMMDNDLSELDIASGDEKVAIKRRAGEMPIVTTAPAANSVPIPAAVPEPASAEAPLFALSRR